MTISKESWHYKVYSWWYKHKYGYRHPSYINLCPYMRAVLFWSWLRWLWIDGRIKSFRVPVIPITLTLSFPFLIAAWLGKQDFRALLFFVATVFGVGAAIFGPWYLWEEKLSKRRGVESFTKLVREYYNTGHSKICPTLEVK